MSKYIVTGGAGFIGSHIVERLVKDGHDVVVVDNLSTGFLEYLPSSFRNPTPGQTCTFLKLDISDWNQLSKNFAYFKGARGVFHLAAVARIQPSIFNPSLTHDTNITGTFNILEMMRMCNIPNIVYSASSSYYGKDVAPPSKEHDPHDCQTPYAISKYMGELYCETWSKLHKINSIRLRYFNVYGPRSPLEGPYAPVIGLFFRQAYNGVPLTIVGDGSQSRDFTYVTDVVQANVSAMESFPDVLCGANKTYNIGTGRNYTIKHLAEMVIDAVKEHGVTATAVHVPERIGEAMTSLAGNERATQELFWSPKIELKQAVRILAEYYKNNLHSK
jgi:UDP-glucose 4-epimerase